MCSQPYRKGDATGDLRCPRFAQGKSLPFTHAPIAIVDLSTPRYDRKMKSDLLSVCRSYVSAQTCHSFGAFGPREPELATITISRQAGARGRTVARLLAEQLNSSSGFPSVPWTIFDRDLMDYILADHDLPQRLARFFPEARWGELDSTINALLGRHPDVWTIFEHTVDTIRKLAHLGHAIVVGRGANFITRGFHNVLDVRLIGSLHSRLDHLCATRGWGTRMAHVYINSEDRNRRAYVRQHFDADIEDPKGYSLVLNTDRLKDAHIVQMLSAWVSAYEANPVRKRTTFANYT